MSRPVTRLLCQFCQAPPRHGGPTDAELLQLYLDGGDGAAFAALVRRHGAMVLGVCRRVLRHEQDAEDAFQAAFLVLARKAASVGRRELLGNWLYGVAYRTALAARARSARRAAREKQVKEMPHPEVGPEESWQDLVPVLDRELARLPEKYRLPVVLCELEGRSRKDATRMGPCQQSGPAPRAGAVIAPARGAGPRWDGRPRGTRPGNAPGGGGGPGPAVSCPTP